MPHAHPSQPLEGPFGQSEPSTHLMIVHPRYAPDLISGRKSVEARLGRDRRTPFGRVTPGDLVYMKSSNGPVFAAARVARVDEFEGLTPDDIDNLRDTYEERVMGGEAYWDSKSDATFATLIWLDEVRPVVDADRVPTELLGASRSAWRTISPDEARRGSQAA